MNIFSTFFKKLQSLFSRNDKPVTPPVAEPQPVPAPARPMTASTDAFHSSHFKLSEFYHSDTASEKKIDNTPSPGVVVNLNWLCQKILDPLRQKLGKPIQITSGYRSAALNALVGGVNHSQHSQGLAADISVAGMTAGQLFEFITQQTSLPYDQVIQEFDRWVHISYDKNLSKQRGQKLIAKTENGKTVYKPV